MELDAAHSRRNWPIKRLASYPIEWPLIGPDASMSVRRFGRVTLPGRFRSYAQRGRTRGVAPDDRLRKAPSKQLGLAGWHADRAGAMLRSVSGGRP